MSVIRKEAPMILQTTPTANDPDFYHWWLSERFDHSCDLADMERAWLAGAEHANKQEEQDDV